MVWFLLNFAGETGLVLHQRNTARREKSSYLQRNTSMAVEDVHHHDQGHLWWIHVELPSLGFWCLREWLKCYYQFSASVICVSLLFIVKNEFEHKTQLLGEVWGKYAIKNNFLWGDWWYTAAFASLPEETRFKKKTSQAKYKARGFFCSVWLL